MALILACLPAGPGLAVQFADVTSSTGPFPASESWGLSARDFDGDGWPDLFANNHRERMYLYRNQGDGTFTDVTLAVDKSDTWVQRWFADQHGATWTDFDNDGDQDLWVSTGICCDAQLLVNQGGYFVDQTAAYGVANDGGGHALTFIDFDHDGRSDVLTHHFNTSRAWIQNPQTNEFRSRTKATGIDRCGIKTGYVQVADFSTDGKPDLLCVDETQLGGLFDYQQYPAVQPFVDITPAGMQVSQVPDSAVGDFDNDGQSDLFVLRGFLRQHGVKTFSGSNLEASFSVFENATQPGGFTFAGGEVIQVDVDSVTYPEFRITIGGSDGYSPTGQSFTLNSADPGVQYDGTLNHDPAEGHELYIGYNTTTGRWDFIGYKKLDGAAIAYIQVNNLGSTPFTDEVLLAERSGDLPRQPSLLMNTDGEFTDEAAARGLGVPVSCGSVSTGDFDNDMDLDLYMVCRTAVSNEPNLLYLNDGTGHFTLAADVNGGAVGLVGTAVGDGAGTGDSAVAMDYDVDGFLDLFVSNGLNLQPDRVGAQNQVYRNRGNANRWLAIDLEGVVSERDAIGAKVYVTAGGVTQLREQGNGYHRWSQDNNRLHFGLGNNTTASRIRVEWPSGQVDEFTGVAASRVAQVYRIVEGTSGPNSGSLLSVELGSVVPLPGPQLGNECGEPRYDHHFGPTILIWKDCTTGVVKVRAMGGNVSTGSNTYAGELTGSQTLGTVTPVSLGGNDSLDTNRPDTVGFSIDVAWAQESGFDVDVIGQASLCLDVTVPSGLHALVGAQRWPLSGPIDLVTMSPCQGRPRTASVSDVEASEDAGTVTVEVALSLPFLSPLRFDYVTADGSATAGLDYTAAAATVTIPGGERTATIDVPLLGDDLEEGNETFSVTLSNPPPGIELAQAMATVTLVDDDGADQSGSEPDGCADECGPDGEPPGDGGSDGGNDQTSDTGNPGQRPVRAFEMISIYRLLLLEAE